MSLPINQIICGDCLKVMQDFLDNSIDHIIADLPFFQVSNASWDNLWKTEQEYLDWILCLVKQYKRILKENSNLFIFTSRQNNRKIATILDSYFIEKRIIVWARKRNFNQSRGLALASGYEPICYYSNSSQGVFHNLKIKPKTTRKEYLTGSLKDGITLSDVWTDISALPHNSKEKVLHPTQKPITLIERLVLLGTNENDIILDNCIGSGTTAVAAIKLNRNYIGIDISQEYCDLAQKRIKDELVQENMFRNVDYLTK